MKVVISRTDGSTTELSTHTMPWQYRTLLVVDTGTKGRLTYVPLDTIEKFEVEGAEL